MMRSRRQRRKHSGGMPNLADGGIAAEARLVHRFVTSGPYIVVQGVDLVGERVGADGEA